MHPYLLAMCSSRRNTRNVLTAGGRGRQQGRQVTNIQEMAEQNKCYLTALWTGCHLQMTLMSIPPCRDIGAKLHPDMDQLIRVEKGNAMVMTGNCPHNLNCEQRMCKGDAVFVPARTWHNIKNTGKCPLRLSTIYAPPHHPFGTVEYTKEDA